MNIYGYFKVGNAPIVRLCPDCGRIQLGDFAGAGPESPPYFWHADGTPDACKPREEESGS